MDLSDIEALLIETNTTNTPAVYIEQKGPLYQSDVSMTCTSRRCGAPTFYKLNGMPMCTRHCLLMMNEMLIERG